MENFNQKNVRIFWVVATLILFSLSFNTSWSQPSITLNPVITTNVTSPMQVINAGDGSQRIFIVERAGTIKVFNGTTYALLGNFLDISAKIGGLGGEGGLLSVTFHPDYEKSGDPNEGDLFVYYTDKLTEPNCDLVLAKYKVANPSANTATVLSTTEILRIPHPNNSNHNGGEMHFDKTGLLYLSVGDGGGTGDRSNNAQKTGPLFAGDRSYLLGKMLRINVDITSGTTNYSIPSLNPFGNEIFSYGLRNPFRWSFDSSNDDIWIGDVGQEHWEEIDFSAASTTGGVNYGWNCFEGNVPYDDSQNPNCGSITNYLPAYVYDGQSVVGGAVYRGGKYIDLKGYYVGTDYYTGNIHLLKRNDANTAWITSVQLGTVLAIPNFHVTDVGESENGELYFTSLTSNTIYHVESSGPLPVKLVNFDGVKTTEGVRLSWETTVEENFKEFEVEYSQDMNNFSKIGTVSANNTLNNAKYQFSHSFTSSGNNYYRLKMIDQDASFEYSRIIAVNKNESLAGNFVRPSLINSGIMNVTIEGNYQLLEMVSTNGTIVYKQNLSGKNGPLDIPVNTASSGIYIVRLISNDQVKQQKVLVLH